MKLVLSNIIFTHIKLNSKNILINSGITEKKAFSSAWKSQVHLCRNTCRIYGRLNVTVISSHLNIMLGTQIAHCSEKYTTKEYEV